MIKVLFYFGHPSQFLFAKNAIKVLIDNGNTVDIVIKKKDVLENLLLDNDMPYTNILPEGRSDSKWGIVLGLLKRDYRLLKYLRGKKYDLMLGTDPSISHVGKIKGIPSITFLEDDIDVVPRLAKTTYPFTTHIFAPNVCNVGENYETKKIGYEGYMKLAYLHPDYFRPDPSKRPNNGKPYILMRFAKLTAHHDDNINGLSFHMIDQILVKASERFDLFINSEIELPERYESLRLRTPISDIHHVLKYSDLFISDSQSMTVEACMLGTPSIRYSDFAGKISVIDELEFNYGLTTSITPPNTDLLLETTAKFLNNVNKGREFQLRREKMLADKIDVTQKLVDLIQNYTKFIN